MITLRPAASREPPDHTRQGVAPVAWLLASLALLAGGYAIGIAVFRLPFNSGSWVVGEPVAIRGWVAYLLSAMVYGGAAVGVWRDAPGRFPRARWLAIVLLGLGLSPAVAGISAAVVDLRISGIALWGAMIVLRSAALYLLLRRE
jgi:hypothetical protein